MLRKVYLFFQPRKFFQIIRKEKTIRNAFFSYVFTGITVTILSLTLSFLLAFTSGNELIGFISVLYLLILPRFLAGLILTFFWSALFYVSFRLFTGKGTYVQTYNVYTYSVIPSLLLAGIPLIGYLGVFYSIFLLVFGFSRLHHLSISRTLLASLIPMLIVLSVSSFIALGILDFIVENMVLLKLL